jgi:4'-phosphopantetheinyl transferase
MDHLDANRTQECARNVPWNSPELRAGDIHVIWFELDLAPSQMMELEPLLSPEERARADRYRFPRDRDRFIAGRGRLRTAIGRSTGRAAGELEFEYGPFGKPALRGGSDDQIQFNLSCCGGLGALALCLDEELGIDVERIRPFDHALAIAARVFAADEYRALRSLPKSELWPAFFSYWARKEALVKSIGRGLSSSLAAFNLSPDPGSGPESVAMQCDGIAVTRWVRTLSAPRESFVAALARSRSEGSVQSWTWNGG